jgi:hypothetical protein
MYAMCPAGMLSSFGVSPTPPFFSVLMDVRLPSVRTGNGGLIHSDGPCDDPFRYGDFAYIVLRKARSRR